MTWQAVARKDIRDAIRSRWLHGATLFFALFLGGTAAIFFGPLGAESVSNLFGIFVNLGFISFSFTGLVGLVLGFFALSTSYGAITDERESGAIKLLLSLPNSRLDVVVGKVIGRSAVVMASVLVGFVVTFIVLITTGAALELDSFAPQILLTLMLGVAFGSIGLGISALANSNREATLATMGLYLMFAVLWGAVTRGIPRIINAGADQIGFSGLSDTASAELTLFLSYLNPLRAYETLSAELYLDSVQARLVTADFTQQQALAPSFSDSLPPYFSAGALVLILLIWTVAPVILGYYSFQKADL